MDLVTFLDTFTVDTLTDTVQRIPAVPTLLSRYFETDHVATTRVFLDLETEGLSLVPDSQRGSHGPSAPSSSKREAIPITAAHLVQTDAIFPEELQNERRLGSTELTTVDMAVLKKLARRRRNIEATLEYHRVGAVQGKVLDADGSTVLYDLYEMFGLDPNAAEDVTWPSSSSGKVNPLLQQFNSLTDRIELAVSGNYVTGIVAIVGSEFWDYLTTNPFVRESFNLWNQRQSAYGDMAKEEPFRYGGIDWIRYNKVVGATTLVKTDEAHVFPVGPGLLKHYFAPADYIDAVNMTGLEYYAKAKPDAMDKKINLEVQSNPITIHKFPDALFTLKSKAE